MLSHNAAKAATSSGGPIGWSIALVAITCVTYFLTSTHMWENILHVRPVPGQRVLVAADVAVFVRDPALDHPMISETVTEDQLEVFVIANGVMIALLEGLIHGRASVMPRAAALFMAAVALNEFTTDFAKYYIGAFRPNFYSGCGWSDETRQCTSIPTFLRKSFPSGHSSHSWNAATMLTLRALAHLRHQYQYQSLGRSCQIWPRLLVPIPCAIAGFISCSRVRDFWHHPVDIAAGSALGAAIAALFSALAWPAPHEHADGTIAVPVDEP